MPAAPAPSLVLIPAPRRLAAAAGTLALADDMYILLDPHPATRDLFAAERFILDAEPLSGVNFHMAVGGVSVDSRREIRVRFDEAVAADAPEAVRDQGYRLDITPEGITLSARAAAGTFYGFQTLLQIVRLQAFDRLRRGGRAKGGRGGKKAAAKPAAPLSLPCVTIDDFPDLPRRGVYHDTARGKVPTVDTLLQLIDDLAHLKYNEFQLYVENAFEFRKYPEVHDDTDPFTAEELLILDAACRARHMDFVPSLTSLGHFEKFLSRPRLRPLAEAEPAQLKALNATCWHDESPWSLCVTDPGAKGLLKDLYDEFLPNFTSRQFNICCDEAYDLGVVRSKEYAERIGGAGPLYLEWIRYCTDLAKGHGKRIQMWGDIILKYPDLISQLPEDALLLEWGYEHNHKFDENCVTFAERLGIRRREEKRETRNAKREKAQEVEKAVAATGRAFYVAPGTSSWLTLSARTKNAFGNMHNAATNGLKHGAAGMLVTDWGDLGHQQLLAVSLASFAYGAAAGWNLAVTPNPHDAAASAVTPLLQAMSYHLFQDPSGTFAGLAYDLGLMYERFGWQRFNGSVDWFLFREKWDFANYVNRAVPKNLPKVVAACEKLAPRFAAAELLRPDGDLLKAEFVFTCDEIVHTCRRTALRQAWLAADPAKRNPEEETLRNKPPRPLPATFRQEMKALGTDAKTLRRQYEGLWLARNKRSRLADVTKEFDRLVTEYTAFAKG